MPELYARFAKRHDLVHRDLPDHGAECAVRAPGSRRIPVRRGTSADLAVAKPL